VPSEHAVVVTEIEDWEVHVCANAIVGPKLNKPMTTNSHASQELRVRIIKSRATTAQHGSVIRAAATLQFRCR
jgi:hypothetical protein